MRHGKSAVRRLLKRILRPLLHDSVYGTVQAAAMAWDIRRGAMRESEVDLLPLVVRPGEAAVDLGANYGAYSYHLSRLVGTEGRVYAFEPIPFTARTFRRVASFLSLRNVVLIEKGVSDQPGQVSFTLPIQVSGALAAGQAHIAGRADDRPGKEIHHQYETTRSVTCEVVRIDDEIPTDRQVSFVKADIEGAELLAFRGAQRLIERDHPTVLCEINTWFLQGFGLQLEDLSSFFREREYVAHRWDVATRRLPEAKLAGIVDNNYVFVHPRRRDRLTSVLE